MISPRTFLILLTLLSLCACAHKEEQRNFLGLPAGDISEPLVTDRPDATESADAVPPGRFQLEMGYTFTRDEGIRSHGFPEALLRVGLVENVELRLGWAGWTFEEGESLGGSDLSVGGKVKLLEQQGLRPNLGVLFSLSLPAGSDETTSGDVDPEVIMAWAYDLTDRIAVAGNVLAGAPTSERGRFFQTGSSLTVAVSLTERLGAYLEYFGRYPAERGEDAEHSLNGGLTFLVTPNVQLDARVGLGLNEQAEDFFTGAGISLRF